MQYITPIRGILKKKTVSYKLCAPVVTFKHLNCTVQQCKEQASYSQNGKRSLLYSVFSNNSHRVKTEIGCWENAMRERMGRAGNYREGCYLAPDNAVFSGHHHWSCQRPGQEGCLIPERGIKLISFPFY